MAINGHGNEPSKSGNFWQRFLSIFRTKQVYFFDGHESYREQYHEFLVLDIEERIREKGMPPVPELSKSKTVVLERIRLNLLSDEELDGQTEFSLRRFEAIADAKPVTLLAQDATPSEKRAWNAQVLWEGHRLLLSNQNKAMSLGNHIRDFSINTLRYLTISSVIFLFLEHIPYFTVIVPPFLFAMIAGSLGGAINHLRKLTSAKLPKGPEVLSYEIDTIRRSSMSTTVSGALYGLVIFFMACSGIGASLGQLGELFPVITQVRDTNNTVFALKDNFGLRMLITGFPESAEYAKLLVWCFASGFIPNLVPDFVSSLHKKKAG